LLVASTMLFGVSMSIRTSAVNAYHTLCNTSYRSVI